MDNFSQILEGFAIVLEPQNLLFCLIGVVIGMFIGVLPGLGPTATISILLPITYAMDPIPAIIMLAGIYYGSIYGGTITAVLLKLPGDASSVVTSIDGYEMAKKGRGGPALAIAAVASFLGGSLAILGMMFLAPLVASVALDFGPPEYAALALLGILLVSTFGSGTLTKCLMMAALGLMFAAVGMDPITGQDRMSAGIPELADGINFVPLVMGVLGLGEVFYNLDQQARNTKGAQKIQRVWFTAKDWTASQLAILKGAVLGFFLGILPGGGATLASMIGYAAEKKTSKNRKEFGKGAIQGVAAPEAANNAAATSSFIPLLTLGIPSNIVMAVLFGALMIHGITPGPQLIENNPDLFWGVVNSMWIGNLFLLILAVPLIGIFIKLVSVKNAILAPLTVSIVMVGVYTLNNSVVDMWLVLFFGVIGYLIRKFRFDAAPLVLAFILGGIMEIAARQSLLMFDGDVTGFVSRPISGTLIAAIVMALILTPVITRWTRKRAELEGAPRTPTF
ncbi:tripartite tricarboxylate transporter permease [Nesterenkonia massiliensis]|uniref:tripartite tricarboxylate transporter permease n=1 Tax=Nesterenkonia massiliensis TaxID=1232429 RepID=UPI00040E9FA6|nr:tripartite tricarboxylate transporter permease [Nesterenkonia massiliensis]